ncbi:ParB/RepB/Spo0J family partition protein [Streptomyces sp. NPDC048521]|uniref:ParB/RepB/Spo0J family partition protein n=1 Tax=Streptomyces sp. NPDC048521 TaxID=3365566 RepID=UPI00371D229E
MSGDSTDLSTVTELPVTLISDNPDNPRNHLRNLDETVETVREVGIILPIVVATVDAYLRDRPDRANDLDDGAQYVVVDGHRRLEASRRVGLAVIPVRVDNARVATDETLLEAAFIANYHRDDMTDLEEAHALQQLVEYYGSQTKASKRLGIAQSTLASKLSLLKLTPELQKDLMTGERRVEHVRNLGKLSPEEQKAKADERAEVARKKAQAKARPIVEVSAGPADYHGVIIPEAAEQPARPVSTVELKGAPAREDPAESIPEPRQQTTSEAMRASRLSKPSPFPYDSPGSAAMYLVQKTTTDDFFELVRLLNAKALEMDPSRLESIVRSLLGMPSTAS